MCYFLHPLEQATGESLPSEDWGLNLEVCDLVNESEDGPRDAIKAIRKRLTTQPKNYTVVMYTLTVCTQTWAVVFMITSPGFFPICLIS